MLKPLWSPSRLRIKDSNMYRFMQMVNREHGKQFSDYASLYSAVAKVAASLKKTGVAPGDRVGGFMPNMPESILAMLAVTSLGAFWSSCSPDFGVKGVLKNPGSLDVFTEIEELNS